MKIFLIILALLVAYITIRNNMTSQLGVKNGRLSLCPSAPRCVSSQSLNPKQKVEPLPYRLEGIETLAEIVETMPDAKIVTRDEVYLHAVFSSPFFRFKDDIEFYRNDETEQIDVRSASRVGYYDLDVNRKRVEKIRSIYLNR